VRKLLLVMLTLLALATFTAAASSLAVNDSVLQVSAGDANIALPEPPAPPVATVDIFVTARLYAGGSQNLDSIVQFGPYAVPDGSTVDIGWTQTVRICPSNGANAVPQPNGIGEVDAQAGLNRVICAQRGQDGSPTVLLNGVVVPSSGTPVTLQAAGGDTTAGTLTSADPEDIEEPSISTGDGLGDRSEPIDDEVAG
jgi:hypothetical protein